MSSMLLKKEVLDQINKIDLQNNKPLLISDADEVILNFIRTFELYLADYGLYYDTSSYALFGNIKKIKNKLPVSNDKIIEHLNNFYNAHTENISFVNDSIKYLKKINSELEVQIIVLSNLPSHNRKKREISFKKNGLHFPIISNSGLKGAAIKEIVKNQNNKIFFIDDISANLLSAHKEVKGIRLIHYISDERLAMLATTPPEIHLKATDWENIYEYIKNETI